jgi:hypothetical protein
MMLCPPVSGTPGEFLMVTDVIVSGVPGANDAGDAETVVCPGAEEVAEEPDAGVADGAVVDGAVDGAGAEAGG